MARPTVFLPMEAVRRLPATLPAGVLQARKEARLTVRSHAAAVYMNLQLNLEQPNECD